MIVSLEHGFVFVKGIKVGGSSVELFLSEVLEEEAIVAPANFGNPAFRPRNYTRPDGESLNNHATAVRARDFLGAERFNSLRRALIVRNPFEKIRSFFYFKIGKGFDDITVDGAIAGCSSEADRALDEAGANLITDVIVYERLNEDLAAFFASVDVPFGGRLDVFEKSWQRRRYGHIPVTFDAAQQGAVRAKFAFEFDCYARAELAVPTGNVAHGSSV